MSLIKVEIYADECEVVGIKQDNGARLTVEFSEELDGYLTFGGAVARVCDKKCILDKGHIGNGAHDPALITENRIIRLPRLMKTGRHVELLPPSEEYIRRASIRERNLEERVKALEGVVSALEDKVYKTTILN